MRTRAFERAQHTIEVRKTARWHWKAWAVRRNPDGSVKVLGTHRFRAYDGRAADQTARLWAQPLFDADRGEALRRLADVPRWVG
jgi:hypothetical protein